MVMKFSGDTGLTFPDNSVQLVAAFSSGRSRIDNGDMRWDQRNNGAASTVAVGAYNFPVDRMCSIATGAAVTAQRVAGTGAYPYDLLYTGAAGNTEVQLRYHIESIKCDDLKNKDVTFQIQLSRNVTSDVTWYAYSANAADNWSASTLLASGTFSAVGSTPLIRSINFNAGANAANGIQVRVSFGALTAGQTVRASGLQLEPGTNLLPFERIDPSEILRRIQRYYWRQYGPAALVSSDTLSSTAYFAFPVPMRATPVPAHTFIDANYVNTSPTGTQWNLQKAGIAYAAKQTTIQVAQTINANLGTIVTWHANSATLWNVSPTTMLTSGPSAYIEAAAEIY